MSELLAIFSTVRWQDVVDILINSYILFRVYVVFQGTNALRVLVGITSLWILREVAASIGLILTSWAVTGITTAAAVIIIVVFRNEIRTALQARNLRAFLWGAPAQAQAAPIESITESIYQMGKKRIGALIVFPGKEDISEVVHGGIAWNGTVSQEMLLSIFWPKNPVHDGAIIVTGNRVHEVGVLLPLSQRQDLPSFYGTRHRAAAGLAERTDALVVAVSEERGRVTVAKDNWIKPIGQAEELQQILKKHYNLTDGVPVQQRRRDRVKHSIAGVLSFLIITGIWLGFTRGQDKIVALNIPIEYVNRPANFEILEASVDEVRVQLFGSSALINSLKPGQVQVRVDLKKSAEGSNIFPISQENIVVPPGVFLNKVQPSTIEVTLDVPATKELPIQVDWVGRLPDNLFLVKSEVVPDTVKVIGGRKILEKVSTIFTTPVRLDSLTRSGSVSTGIVLTPPSLKLASGAPERISIVYSLEDRMNESQPQ